MLVAPVVQVQYNPDVTGPRHLIAAVEDAGFDAEAISIDRWAQLSGASCAALHTYDRDKLAAAEPCAGSMGFPIKLPLLMSQPL